MGIHHLYGFFAADAEEILRNIYGGSLYYPVIVFEQQVEFSTGIMPTALPS